MKKWIKSHPNLIEFILFNVLSNCATVTNFVLMWFCTGLLFKEFQNKPFRFFIFDYTSTESLGLCGFLSFFVATALAQLVNYIVQKNIVFKSNADFKKAIPRYVCLAVMLVIVSAALPAYSQKLLAGTGMPTELVPTVANLLNILLQVVISYPAMKLWIMP